MPFTALQNAYFSDLSRPRFYLLRGRFRFTGPSPGGSRRNPVYVLGGGVTLHPVVCGHEQAAVLNMPDVLHDAGLH